MNLEIVSQWIYNNQYYSSAFIFGGWGGGRWEGEGVGRFFEVGANSRLGAYSNKYGRLFAIYMGKILDR